MKLRLLIWAIILIGVRDVITEACAFPPIAPGSYVYLYSWRPGPRVLQVHIDDAFNVNPAIVEQLRHGVFNWNVWGLVDCSLVEFAGGGTQSFGPEVYANNYFAPPGNVYIVSVPNLNCANGGCVLTTTEEGRAVGAKIMFDPAVWSANQSAALGIGYYSWASSHEIGHTFGLFDHFGAYPGASAMAG